MFRQVVALAIIINTMLAYCLIADLFCFFGKTIQQNE